MTAVYNAMYKRILNQQLWYLYGVHDQQSHIPRRTPSINVGRPFVTKIFRNQKYDYFLVKLFESMFIDPEKARIIL